VPAQPTLLLPLRALLRMTLGRERVQGIGSAGAAAARGGEHRAEGGQRRQAGR